MAVDLSTNGGSTYTHPIYHGAYHDTVDWTVPSLPSESCRLRAVVGDGQGNLATVMSDSQFIIRPGTAGVGDRHGAGGLALDVRPAITSGPVTIRFAVPWGSGVRVVVEDLMGRHRRVLAAARYLPGQYTVIWDLTDDEGRALEPGVYYVRLEAEARVLRHNLVVLR